MTQTSPAVAVDQVIRAYFPIHGPDDYDAFFAYVHELLLAEGTTTSYEIIAPSIQAQASVEATQPAAELAAAFRSSIALENLSLPELVEPDHKFRADQLGVQLASTDREWLRRQHKEWVDLLNHRPATNVVFSTTIDVDPPAASGFARLFRAFHWIFTEAGLDSGGSADFQADWALDGAKRHALEIAGDLSLCRHAKTKIPTRLCDRLMTAIKNPSDPSQGLKLRLEFREERAAVRISESKIHRQAKSLDQLDRAIEAWKEIAVRPWDIDPAKLKDIPAPRTVLKCSLRFDERAELAPVLEVVHRLLLEEAIEPDYEIFGAEGRVGRAQANEESHHVEKRIRWAKHLALQLPELRNLQRSISVADGSISISTAAPEWDQDWVENWLQLFEAALRRPLRTEFVQTCDLRLYAEVNAFLVFKALSWLTADALDPGPSPVLEFLLSDPEERYQLPVNGKAMECAACGLRMAENLCVDLVNCASVDRFLSLNFFPDKDTELGVSFVEKRVVAKSSVMAKVSAAIDSWLRIEQRPIGDP